VERRHSDITHIFRYYANRLNKLNQSEINDVKLIFEGKKIIPILQKDIITQENISSDTLIFSSQVARINFGETR